MLSNAMHTVDAKELNKTTTLNGATTFRSTLNANLDFYSRSGNINYPDVVNEFELAFLEDQDLALRNLLKMRDVRGGHGVRSNYRKVLRHLAENHLSFILNTDILNKTIEVGRWDDIFELLTLNMPTLQNRIVKLVATELNKGAENSLVAKWLPINSRKTYDQRFLSHLRSYMKLTPKQLRNMVVSQRKELVEVKMSAKRFTDINYSHVPSHAMKVYRKAFKRHDPEGMALFLEKASKGEVKVNASTLYPHEVCRVLNRGDMTLADAQWKNLPDYIKGDCKILPLVDVSGSMGCLAYGTFSCMDISIALGLYISERNKSEFKDLCLTFETSPRFVSLCGLSTLQERYSKLARAPWGGSTNIYGAFEKVLKLAKEKKIPKAEMPEVMLVLTDMQYDQNPSGINEGIMKSLRRAYKEAGYDFPKVVWWNLNSRIGKTTPVKKDKDGTCIVSGSSPSLLEAVLADDLESYTPMNVMLRDLMSDRYKVTHSGGSNV